MSRGNKQSEDLGKFIPAKVHPSHISNDNGVRFNVQTIESLGDLLPFMGSRATMKSIQTAADKFYESKTPVSSRRRRQKPSSATQKCKLEAHSVPSCYLVKHPARSLAHIALTAFANHYPLTLRPDDIWLAVACGAAKHIDKNKDALRSRLVNFQGKKDLVLHLDDAVMGHVPKHVWEENVFRNFSHQIRKYVGKSTHDLVTARFSTTTRVDKAAAEITLMSSVSKYFNFTMYTRCGIPEVELHGSLDDWMQLRERAEKLKTLLLDDFAENWMKALLPMLDEFVEAYKGNVNHEFWQRMVKKTILNESGRYASLSGWIINLYPYLADGSLNPYIMPWEQMRTDDGPEPEEIPSIISSVPVSWDYYDQKFALHFHAGIVGMTQNWCTKSLQPCIGWFISHDPSNVQMKTQLQKKR